jgi:hypothetical protein
MATKVNKERPVPLFGAGGFIETDPEKMLTEQGGRWLLRQHKERLVAAGAILIIAGKTHVRPSIWRRVVIELGEEAARAKVVSDKAREVSERRSVVKSLEAMLDAERTALRTAEAAAKREAA